MEVAPSIVQEDVPVNSTELVRLCREKLGWSKATTYTVIKRLSMRGVVKNENAVVTSPVSYTHLDVYKRQVLWLLAPLMFTTAPIPQLSCSYLGSYRLFAVYPTACSYRIIYPFPAIPF